MRRFALIGMLAALLAVTAAPSARAAFALEDFNLNFEDGAGAPALQAGAHPFAVTSRVRFHSVPDEVFGEVPEGSTKDLDVELPVGLVGNPTAVPPCSNADFINISQNTKIPHCSDSSAVGVITVRVLENSNAIGFLSAPVYNLVAPRGSVQKLGFSAYGDPIAFEFVVKETQPYNVIAKFRNTPQVLAIYGAKLTIWGNPASPAHNSVRGHCIAAGVFAPTEVIQTTGEVCPSGVAESPFITLARACEPLSSSYFATAWQQAFPPVTGSIAVPTLNGCQRLGFGPTIGANTTTNVGQSSTGLNFNLDVADENLTSTTGLAQSDIKKAVVTLPEGMTVNASLAEGLGACSEADLARETLDAAPDEGCPNSSKIGSVEVETPLLQEQLEGSLYTAKPFENEFGSLLAVYMVIKNQNLGVLIKQALKVVPDEKTGQLTTYAEEIPQLPFSHFRLKFRGGERGPLTTPTNCGSYNVQAVLTPWSGGPPITTTKAFEVTTGGGGAGCGSGQFAPSFEAGTLAPLAGTHSPFILNLSRPTGSPRLSSIETTLPEGLLGKLAGLTECSDGAIATARSRSGPNQGALELASPSCPLSSEVGDVTVGAGSGAQTYVKGKAYLAGPYKGAPLSLVVVTPVVVGPFDLGAVVVRNALYVNPITAQIRAVSDQFPPILQGIPTEIRSISIDLSRPEFTLNPTSCEPMKVLGQASSLLGQAASLASRFQVGGCKGLEFKPKLKLSLQGSTRHAGHPALKAVLTYPKGAGYANVARAQVNLPHSEFIDQGNLNKTCTRPVLLEGTCPATSVYGKAKAWTPLLDKPLEGPLYLVGGFGYKLPALVAELKGQIRVLLVGKVDSGPNHGIRTTFEAVPDAPVEKFVLQMKGGKKYSLLENSENLCAKPQKAIARFTGQNGKVDQYQPVVGNQCGKKRGKNKSTKHAGYGGAN